MKRFLSFILTLCIYFNAQSQSDTLLKTAYPPMKKTQYELGVKTGAFGVSGDVRNLFPGFTAGVHVRKSLGYVFSVRGDLNYATGKGLNYSPSSGYTRNSAWTKNGYVAPSSIYYNYKTTIWDGSLQGVISLNNLSFHRSKTKFGVYGFGGIGGMIYDTKINALNGNKKYDFSSITPGVYTSRNQTKKALKNLMDNTYETQGEQDPLQPKFMGKPFKPMFVAGGGVQFRLNDKTSLSLEERFTSVKTDLLDGQQWQEGNITNPPQSRDYDSYHMITVGLNVHIGKKASQPLWWSNPYDYIYLALAKPVKLIDTDGDGVTDQFDNESNTLSGVQVDTHGVSKDTDGDGVPDYKDRELVTPTQCQPVDSNGVGKCPEPDCCRDRKIYDVDTTLPRITFRDKSVELDINAMQLLSVAANKIKNNPSKRVAVIGYCTDTKLKQKLSWERVNSIINYLNEKEGIDINRFVFKYEQSSDNCNFIDLRFIN